MENYTVSRELAEKLKAAGFPQDKTILTWRLEQWSQPFWKVRERYYTDLPQVAAPMTDELLEQLPWHIVTEYQDYDLTIRSSMAFYEACNNVEDVIPHEYPMYPNFPSIPDALAQLWLWAKANGHIK